MDLQRDRSEKAIITKKKYDRDELFRLGQSLHVNDKPLIEDLEKLRHADWSKYDLDLLDKRVDDNEFKFNSIKPISNFGRQRSELGHDHISLIDQRSELDELRGNSLNYKHNRISRMTSSPTIKYNTKNRLNDLPYDSISNQVKAKYVKLIETLSGPSHTRADLAQRSSLSRTTSLNHERPIERPTHLFGSLRREFPKQSRNNPEEPLSLPYIPPNVHEYPTTSGRKLNTSNQVPYDDVSAPIKRIGACNNQGLERTADGEDDDFDISSLLSITVLSDIKTIRQDAQNCGRAGYAGGFAKSNARSRNQENPMRPLVRARTATEFTYESRQNFHESRRRQQGYLCGNDMNSQDCLRDTYNWYKQQEFSTSREMAQEVQPITGIKDQKPVDESVASIIETFKTQVKARAVGDKSNATSGACHQTKSDQAAPKELEPAEKRDHTSTETIKAPEVKQESKPVEIILQRPALPGKEHNVLIDSNKKDAATDSGACGNLRQSPEVARILSNSNFGGSTEVKKDANIRSISNIPRLISLHKNLSKVSAPGTFEADKEGNSQKSKSDESKAPASKALSQSVGLKTKTKIVSQYKQLRGKSLADEVDETPQ